MTDFKQLVVSSSSEGCINIWDLKTSTTIQTFKQSLTNSNSIAITTRQNQLESIYSCQENKPLIHCHKASKMAVVQKCIMDETISCLKATNSGLYLIGGSASGRIYLWDIRTGDLIFQLQAHYKNITVLRIDLMDEFVYSGSEDTFIKKVPLQALLSRKDIQYNLKGHSLPVTDIYLGSTLNPRIFSTSEDRTCRVFDSKIDNQNESLIDLKTVISYPRPITKVVVDCLERFVLCAGTNGIIYKTTLYNQSKQEKYETLESSGRILDMQFDLKEKYIITATEQGCFVWDVKTRQCISKYQGNYSSCLIVLKPLLTLDLSHFQIGVLKRYQAEPGNSILLESFASKKRKTPDLSVTFNVLSELGAEEDETRNQLELLHAHNKQLRELNDLMFEQLNKK
jgi:WD40 repeat protein